MKPILNLFLFLVHFQIPTEEWGSLSLNPGIKPNRLTWQTQCSGGAAAAAQVNYSIDDVLKQVSMANKTILGFKAMKFYLIELEFIIFTQ